MRKETITYTDYEGNKRTEDFYFNLTESECLKLEMSTDGGMEKLIRKLIAGQKMPEVVEIFEKIVLQSYGEKSPDGKRFIKSEELSTAFAQTEAYNILFLRIATDGEEAAKFVNGVIPNKPQQATPATNVTAMPTQN